MKEIHEVLKLFTLPSENFRTEKINSGHINSTYKIIYSDSRKYILQRINGKVFKNPEEIMSNIKRITSCLKGRVQCPEFMKYRDKNYIMRENEMWRIYPYIENSASYVTLDDNSKIREFGRVTGEFHSLAKTLDTEKFYSTLENFHDTQFILAELFTVKNDNYKREFEFFEKMQTYAKTLAEKNLTLSVTHNDVKCSNVLFDRKTGKGITLIDFDTVMPGLAVYDFGDGVRSACITKSRLDLQKFTEYCNGYFSCNKPEECENYFLGTLCITFELSARYFTDFLKNGNYFSDKTSLQKLERCRELICTAESIVESKSAFISIIQDFL